MHGYSDRINHAFAFAAKYYGAVAPARRPALERKIADKFGPVALAIAKDALEPKYDFRGAERSWQASKQEYLGQLAAADPRALDICVADELHACGSTITA